MAWMAEIENRMELYAGAPKESMGVRSPGEKTMFEVQSLENATGRIYGEKIVAFELFMEEILNDMLELSHKSMTTTDTIRIIDTGIGAVRFKEITKEDITAKGIIRPVGARHFAQKAQELQNLVGVFNSPLGQMIAPHTSAIAVTKFIEDAIDLRGYNMFGPNLAVDERGQTQALAGQVEEDNMMVAEMSEEDIAIEQEEEAV